MIEYLTIRILAESLTIVNLDIVNSILLFEPVTYNALPDKNLTINDLKISPIDDHLTYGIQ